MNEPYIDEHIGTNIWIRTFDLAIVDSDEYVWHRDTKDRTVMALEGVGWRIQMDNELPKLINTNNIFFIPKMEYHRLIVGKTTLKLKIEEAVI